MPCRKNASLLTSFKTAASECFTLLKFLAALFTLQIKNDWHCRGMNVFCPVNATALKFMYPHRWVYLETKCCSYCLLKWCSKLYYHSPTPLTESCLPLCSKAKWCGSLSDSQVRSKATKSLCWLTPIGSKCRFILVQCSSLKGVCFCERGCMPALSFLWFCSSKARK